MWQGTDQTSFPSDLQLLIYPQVLLLEAKRAKGTLIDKNDILRCLHDVISIIISIIKQRVVPRCTVQRNALGKLNKVHLSARLVFDVI